MKEFLFLTLSLTLSTYITGLLAMTECHVKCIIRHPNTGGIESVLFNSIAAGGRRDCRKECEKDYVKNTKGSDHCTLKCDFDYTKLPDCPKNDNACYIKDDPRLSSCKEICEPHFSNDKIQLEPYVYFHGDHMSEQCNLNCPFNEKNIPECAEEDSECMAKKKTMILKCTYTCKPYETL